MMKSWLTHHAIASFFFLAYAMWALSRRSAELGATALVDGRWFGRSSVLRLRCCCSVLRTAAAQYARPPEHCNVPPQADRVVNT